MLKKCRLTAQNTV